MRYHKLSAVALIGFSLCGCATSLPSMSFNDPPNEVDIAASSTALPESQAPSSIKTAQASSTEGSTLSDIWDNFSSVFKSGTAPDAAKSEATPDKGLTPKPGPIQPLDMKQALSLVNAYRQSKGLGPLSINPLATKAAATVAGEMAKNDRMSHYGPNNADVSARLLAAGYSYQIAAENIAVGQRSVQEVMEGWKNSPKHNENLLLANVTHMGIAMHVKPNTKYKTYWALVLAAPRHK